MWLTLIAVVTTAMLVPVVSRPDSKHVVLALNGRLIVNPPTLCDVSANGRTIKDYDIDTDILIFGLITYNCSGTEGRILSVKGCVHCSFYCPENDRISGCAHFASPLFCGILLGVFSSAVVYYGWKSAFLKCKSKYSQFKEERKLSKRRKIRQEVIYMSGKEAMSKSMRSMRPVDDQPIIDEAGYLVPTTSRKNSFNLLETATVGLALSGGLTSYACDTTLYMNSDGKMCDGVTCNDISTYSFNLAVGSVICFTAVDQSLVKFYFEKTEMVYKYDLMYYSSDFEIMSEGYSQCKQAGECYAKFCYEGAQSDKFVSKNVTEGYTCIHEGIGCDFMCWHKYSCTWLHWWLRTTGNLVRVYKKEFSIWSATLVMERSGVKTKVEVNANNPTTNFRHSESKTIRDLPISVDSVLHDTQYIDNYLVVDGNLTVLTDASSVNFPQVNRIGDYQIDIHHGNTKYPIDSVRCYVSGCTSGCITPIPAIRTLRTSKHPSDLITYNEGHFDVKARRPLFLTGKLSIGNFKFQSLYIEHAKCDVEIVGTYGCSACSQAPYAVLRATSIERPGVLPFESNCTFKQPYISCNDELYTLELEKQETCCYLYIRHLNMTKTFCLEYDFVGDMTINSVQYSKSVDLSYIVSSIADNPSFIQGIYGSIVTMTGLAVGASLVSKLISRLIIIRGLKKVNDEV